MSKGIATDYETYQQIIDQLLRPIESAGLDVDTLKRLYESKYVYLENLRVKCFFEINNPKKSPFKQNDYELILQALAMTRNHLHDLVIATLSDKLSRRKIV